jgi:2-iminobutanoate/2-iminopropanoate deaminase
MERRTFLRNGATSSLVAAVVPAVAGSSAGPAETASRTKMDAVFTERAPKPAGPYSQAIRANGFIFAAGQTARDPQTQQIVEGDITVQTERVLENLKLVLNAAGSSLERTVKTTVFLTSMDDFAAMNKVYSRYFPSHPPARSTVEVSRLNGGSHIEIELIALS